MIMRNLLLVMFSVLVFGATTVAQGYEYGSPTDLKGLTTVYIDTHGNIKDREKIIEGITKANLGLTIAESNSSAQVFLDFNTYQSIQAISTKIPTPLDPRYPVHVIQRVKTIIGVGMVAVRGKTAPRVIMNFRGSKRPVSDFVKEFITTYKKANDSK